MKDPLIGPMVCPLPIEREERIQMAHGGGGRRMRELIDTVIVPAFAVDPGFAQHDAAVENIGGIRLALTTDSFVVNPLFFPGGDIGVLAVNGTVNDLAMVGARPLCLTAGFVIEEGLRLETLRRVVRSMRHAADVAGVRIVTGDTKVVEKGRGDGIFINTSGVGLVGASLQVGPEWVRPGDAVVVSGDLGRHGIAVMAAREGLGFETALRSDTTSLASLVSALLDAGIEVHCLRDLTRGGLVSGLNEIATSAGVSVEVDEPAVPVDEAVRGACELLGLDPLYVANEGRCIAFVAGPEVGRALDVMRAHPDGDRSAVIGLVSASKGPPVVSRGALGTRRVLDMLSGEQLPRIC